MSTETIAPIQPPELIDRQAEVWNFKRFLASKKLIYSIHGVGGIGKSRLLNEFQTIAAADSQQPHQYLSTKVDENFSSFPDVLDSCAQRIEEFLSPEYRATSALKDLRELFSQYKTAVDDLTKKHKIEKRQLDQLVYWSTRVLASGARIYSGVGNELVSHDLDDAIAKSLSKTMQELKGKLDEAEIDKVRTAGSKIPEVFIKTCNQLYSGRGFRVLLFIDAFERIAHWLESELLDLLNNKHGAIKFDLRLIIAGRRQLGRPQHRGADNYQDWLKYPHLMERNRIEPMQSSDIQTVLYRHHFSVAPGSIQSDDLFQFHGLPLAAVDADHAAGRLIPKNKSVVERQLSYLSLADRNRVLAASAARYIDADVVRLLCQGLNDIPDWWHDELIGPAEDDTDRQAIFASIRAFLVRYAIGNYPAEVLKWHSDLVGHYEKLHTMVGNTKQGRNALYDSHYHKLSVRPADDAYIKALLVDYLSAYTREALEELKKITLVFKYVYEETGEETIAPWARWLHTLAPDHKLEPSGSQFGWHDTIQLLNLLQAVRWDDQQDKLRMYIVCGRVWLRADLLAEAHKCFSLAVKIKTGDANYWRGMLHWQKADYSKALSDFREACRINQSNPLYQYWQGRVCLALNRPAKAMRAFDRVVSLGQSTGPSVWIIKGKYWRGRAAVELAATTRDASRYAAADQDFTAILSASALPAECEMDWVAEIYLRGQQYEYALRYFTHLENSGRNEPMIYRGLGLSLLRAKLPDHVTKAADYFEKAIAKSPPDDPNAVYPLSELYYLLGRARFSEDDLICAAEHFKTACKELVSEHRDDEDGGTEWALKERSIYRIWAAAAYLRHKDPGQAYAMLSPEEDWPGLPERIDAEDGIDGIYEVAQGFLDQSLPDNDALVRLLAAWPEFNNRVASDERLAGLRDTIRAKLHNATQD